VRALVVGALLYPGSVLASPLWYNFSFTPSGGPFSPFAFSIASNDFIGPGPVSFTPFAFTDGINTWTMTQGMAADLSTGGWCFSFATASNATVGPCTAGSSPPDGGYLSMGFGSPAPLTLPTSVGTFTTTSGFVVGSQAVGFGTGTFALTIVDVPEPSTLLMAGAAILVALAAGRKAPTASAQPPPRR
jgi:hypothetical protein